MAMDVGGKKKGPKGDINVTPLIDVVLVLLIIFMVLTPSMLKHLTAIVPKTEDDQNASQSPAKAPIIVEYTSKRELSVNTEPVAPAALADKLTERLRSDQRKVVFFRADDEAPYGEVVKFMDIARGAGAQTLAIVTK